MRVAALSGGQEEEEEEEDVLGLGSGVWSLAGVWDLKSRVWDLGSGSGLRSEL